MNRTHLMNWERRIRPVKLATMELINAGTMNIMPAQLWRSLHNTKYETRINIAIMNDVIFLHDINDAIMNHMNNDIINTNP